MASFGHAAYFGLGAYGAALAARWLGCRCCWRLPAAPLLGVRRRGARSAGSAVRLSGVYLAMLTLAFAQIVWSIAFQWDAVTGGDNGMLGVWPAAWAAAPAALLLADAASSAALRRRCCACIVFSPFGYALRAARDSAAARRGDRHRPPARAMDGLRARRRLRRAGRRAVRLPQGQRVSRHASASRSRSTPWSWCCSAASRRSPGRWSARIVYKALSIWLVSHTDLSRLVLGVVIVALVLAFPKGIVGIARATGARRRRADRSASHDAAARRSTA